MATDPGMATAEQSTAASKAFPMAAVNVKPSRHDVGGWDGRVVRGAASCLGLAFFCEFNPPTKKKNAAQLAAAVCVSRKAVGELPLGLPFVCLETFRGM